MELDKIQSTAQHIALRKQQASGEANFEYLAAKDREEKAALDKLSGKKVLNDKEDAKLKGACRDFESYFLYYLLKQMRETVPKSGLMDESRPMQFYREMFDEKIADAISRSPNNTGLADMLYKNLKDSMINKVTPEEVKK